VWLGEIERRKFDDAYRCDGYICFLLLGSSKAVDII
jgi:hypothetical protein